MSLEPVSELMRRARRGGYAIGYFESWNIESLQGVIDAAEQTRAPMFIGFNGDFLSHAGRLAPERLAWYAALGKAAAESAAVPCALIFNECAQDAWVREAIDLGFGLVMPADPAAPDADYLQRVTALAKLAHQRGVAVEAELGELPFGAAGGSHHSSLTDPETAAAFVAATKVDLLAVSTGNVHVKLAGAAALDLEHLRAIRARVAIPLVLHGGTGVAADSLRAAINLGVAKVNYGTYLKQRYLKAVRAALATAETNPHELLSRGGASDVMVAGRRAVRDAVLERIDLLGCCGKAW